MDPWMTNCAPSGTSTPHRPDFTTALLSDYSQHCWGRASEIHWTQLGNCTAIHTITVRLDDINKCYYMCYTVGVITNNPAVSHRIIRNIAQRPGDQFLSRWEDKTALYGWGCFFHYTVFVFNVSHGFKCKDRHKKKNASPPNVSESQQNWSSWSPANCVTDKIVCVRFLTGKRLCSVNEKA